MKKVAIIISSPPHGNAKGREALDIALATSAFNQISVFFVDDGVFHLLPNQQPDEILMRDYIATFNMLELYDIDNVYVCESSLKSRNLVQLPRNIPSKLINNQLLTQLLTIQDVILRF
ncbi:sulfurtransferase complex subunit TusC [Gilliamella sp. Pas-s95]|uniref:sulfurtransferase complex subunit TusC n=1 Tax=Gilliamella sp. Pas-s95 TaxID=2687317 RepID=UPI0013277D52|nr:sulfurtransferase complex subunit TusC [Gilliamella sp. Pas-s95]MWN05147.1 sulfurtransferase complex subunit TusC [Gilliamella sp. Pas-s95]